MKIETFFDNFELLTDAPNATVKLREMILQLAVEGRLLSPNPDDEPTLLLLERIKINKKRLIEEKKIPKSKNLLPPSLNEFPYQLSENWQWVRLGEICTKIVDGSHNPPPDQGTGIPMISSQNVLNNEINFSASRYISLEDFEKEMVRTPIEPGDVFLTIVGSIGRSSVVPQNIPNFAIQRSIALIRTEIYPDYLSLFFRSSVAQSYFHQQGKGTAQKGIYLEKLSLLPVAIPPLAEQKRIVEKCDRLLSTCDEIEKRQQQRQQSILRMNESAIAQLLSSQNSDEFRQHWQRICNNFDLLYSIPETIPKLRQAILQLAVEGKLVRQDPNDEPALILLERIRCEREELARERKQAKFQNFPPVVSDEISYQLPQQWIWVPLGELLISSPRNGYSPKPVDYPTKVKSLTLSATTSGRFKNEYFKYIDEEIAEDSHLWLEDGDILIQRANTIEYVGIAAIYKGYSHEYIYPDLMMKIRCSNFLEINYIHLAINNENSRNFLRARATGTSSNMPKINQLTVNSLPIPLPPLAEQKRIVEKCDRLMSLCDTLEAKLKQGRDSSEKLMEVAAKQVLSGCETNY